MSEPLYIWTVYDHPSDFPDNFVARKFALDKPTAEILVSDNIYKLRVALKCMGLVCLTRAPEDDPKIVETWL